MISKGTRDIAREGNYLIQEWSQDEYSLRCVIEGTAYRYVLLKRVFFIWWYIDGSDNLEDLKLPPVLKQSEFYEKTKNEKKHALRGFARGANCPRRYSRY